MNFLVYGAGAVGSYLGGCLALAGHGVVYLARQRTVAALQDDGLHIERSDRTLHLEHAQAASELVRALEHGSPNLILLTVKAYDCRSAGEELAAAETQAPVVSFLNGVGNQRQLVELLGQDRVLAATLTTAVQRSAPNRVNVERVRGVGVAADHPASDSLSHSLRQAGLDVSTYPRADALKWSKLLTNLLANATSAVTGLSAGEIYAHPGLYQLERRALLEAVSAMHAEGIPVYNLPGAPSAWLARLIRLPAWLTRPLLQRAVAGGRGDKRPSMFYDVASGRTEVAWLNGAVVDACDRHGLPAPANRLLTQAVHTLAKHPEDVDERRLSPHALLANAAEIGVPGLRGYNRAGHETPDAN